MPEPIRVRVRLVVLGRGVELVDAESGMSAATLLERVGVDGSGKDIRVNGLASADAALTDGDLVTVIPRIRGGVRRWPIRTV
jgi:hypothetical protein